MWYSVKWLDKCPKDKPADIRPPSSHYQVFSYFPFKSVWKNCGLIFTPGASRGVTTHPCVSNFHLAESIEGHFDFERIRHIEAVAAAAAAAKNVYTSYVFV